MAKKVVKEEPVQAELPLEPAPVYQLFFPSAIRVSPYEIAFVLNNIGIRVMQDVYDRLTDSTKAYFVKVG